MLVDVSRALELVGPLVHAGDVELGACMTQAAGVKAPKGAIAGEAAKALLQIQAALVVGVCRVELDCRAKVAVGRHSERARALRNDHMTHVLVDNGAADMQPIQVAVAHITKRYVVQREAKLVLAEAAHADAQRPLVGAVGVGLGDLHRGQVRERGDGAGAGRGFL